MVRTSKTKNQGLKGPRRDQDIKTESGEISSVQLA